MPKKQKYIPKRQKPPQKKSQLKFNKTNFPNGKRKNRFLAIVVSLCIVGVVMTAAVIFTLLNTLFIPEPVATTIAEAPLPTPAPTPRPTPTPVPTVAPTPEPTPDPMLGMALSHLTGLPIPEEIAPLRPVAVVINNHSRALPQSGISQADIIYEVLAEGDITRLVAIFQHLDVDRIGPVRSTREYFSDFALENDAIFVHHGGSPSGYARLRNFGIDHFDGMALEGITFWRDPVRRNISGMYEHSSYTGAEELETAFANRNIRRNRYENDNLGFAFNNGTLTFQMLAMSSGGNFSTADEIIVPFSSNYPRRFVYNPATLNYAVYNVYGPHIDENIEDEELAQLHVDNVLIQTVASRVIPGDEAGRREVTTIGSGTGYLATMGTILTVRWQRDSIGSPTRWYFENGTPLQLTPGQTWLNILQNTAEIEIIERIEQNPQIAANEIIEQ
ncbi:MAG: DUF3048 domain-containing protein [Firmicutes bacterium]|nr:DUF3048 domain-containing protein [Bacillota bacterium]